MRRKHILILPLLATLALAGQVQAHARLVSSDPAAGARVSHAPSMIEVQFNERLEPKFSGFEITRAGAKADVGPVSLDGPKGLMAVPKTSLGAGDYVLHWHAVTADGHRAEGDVPFSVR